MRLVAHAAVKYTGRPAVLSPLLDSCYGWENKKSRFSCEPAKYDIRTILSVSGVSTEELEVDYNRRRLVICMKHGSKLMGDKNLKWKRDCTYEYRVHDEFVHLLSAYRTDDDFLVIQQRQENGAFEKEVKELNFLKIIPIDLIQVLAPALNVPFLKQILNAAKKKSGEVCSYVNAATEVPEADDVLSLLTCIPLTENKKLDFDFEKEFGAEEPIAGQSSDGKGKQKHPKQTK